MSNDRAHSPSAGLLDVLLEAATREENIIIQLIEAVRKDDRKAILKSARLLAENRANSDES